MTNHVRKFRLNARISQKKFAEQVGIQQIELQRLEVGKGQVTLNTARTICSGLSKAINAVFPGALKALEVLKKESSPFTANAESAVRKLRQTGIEMDVRSHRLKVLLRGHAEAILLSISPGEVSQAFSAIQNETPEATGTAFVVFDSKDERTVISLRAILFCQFLWDANFAVCTQPSAETDCQNVVRIYLGENTVPVELSVDPEDDEDEGENSYVNTAIYLLESGGVEASERIHFCDVDGEDVFLRAGDIAMLTVPLWVLDPDERIYDDDMDEDDEGPTPMPAEGGARQPSGAHPGALS